MTVEVECQEGFKIVVPNDTCMGRTIVKARTWQGYITRIVRETVKPDWAFVDVGAAFGFYALLAGSMGCRSVIAMEPNPAYYELICESIVLNGFYNIAAMHVAASDKVGPAQLWLNPGNDGDSRLDSHRSGSTAIPITTARLDDVVHEDGPMFIKIDTQGHEPHVLAGAAKLIERVRPVMVVEESVRLLEQAGHKPDVIRTMLTDMGYTAERLMSGNKVSGDLLARPK